ncbi:MAG: hypothetical protein WD772_00065, partial [Pseudohongiellaceae bacterium]
QMFIEQVCNQLANHQVPYAVVGGHAVALHGAVRGTVDLDLVIRWSEINLENTEKALKELGLVSRLPLSANEVFKYRDQYVKERNLIAWNFYNPGRLDEQVDLTINYDLGDEESVRKQTASGTIEIIPLVSLIKMKRASGRPQDLIDIKALENLKA